MRNFEASLYERLVEDTKFLEIRSFFVEEAALLKAYLEPGDTVVDIGAGYGREIDALLPYCKKIIAVEIHPDMADALKRRYMHDKRVDVVFGDFFRLRAMLEKVERPVFLVASNTLGTIENGSWRDALGALAQLCERKGSRAFISLFRQKGLATTGRAFYKSLEPMIGKIDTKLSDFSKGDLKATKYSSHWFTDKEIREIASLFSPKLKIIRRKMTAFLMS